MESVGRALGTQADYTSSNPITVIRADGQQLTFYQAAATGLITIPTHVEAGGKRTNYTLTDIGARGDL